MAKNKASHKSPVASPVAASVAKTPAPAAIVKPATGGSQQITIDGVTYNMADLADTVKQHLGNVRSVDQELAHLQRQRAIASVARTAYVNAAAASLPKTPTTPQPGARSVVVNNQAHDWASLGEGVQGLLASIRAADQELAQLDTKSKLAQTARGAFASAVKQHLPKGQVKA